MAMRLTLLLVALSCTCSSGDLCERDVLGDAQSGQGMLQMTRARESMTVGNNNGDTASLLAMKAQLKSKLDLGEKLDNDETIFFTDFMDFLRNTSLKNINLTHEGDQQEIDEAFAQVEACNAGLLSSQDVGGEWAETLTNQDARMNSHVACRHEEVTMWTWPNHTCTQVLDFEFVEHHAVHHVREETTPFPGWDAWGNVQEQPLVAWLTTYHTYHCGGDLKNEFERRAAQCRQDALAAKNHRVWCKNNQTLFEQGVCSHKDVVQLDCDTLSECYSNETTRFNQTVDANVAENEYLKVEYTIIRTIICYIELLVGEESQITDENKKACEGPYETDFLNLSIPPLVDMAECDLVSKWPCNAAFVEHYYAQGLPPGAPANLCVAC